MKVYLSPLLCFIFEYLQNLLFKLHQKICSLLQLLLLDSFVILKCELG